MTKDIIERLERRMPATQDMDSTNMCEDMEDAIALIASQARRIAELEADLAWYGEQARLARLIHSGGDAGRHALTADGGSRARALLNRGEG